MQKVLEQKRQQLAREGGEPVRDILLPYSRQQIDEDDVHAVTDVLQSDWLTTGPKVDKFEKAFAEFTGAQHAVAVNSGTAALHAAMYATGIKNGDEVIVPSMTFAATANAVVYLGAAPVFADVDPDTLLIDPSDAESKITEKTKAIVSVDYAGQPCDYDVLGDICEHKNLVLIADACHAVGGSYQRRSVGSLADLSTFSFHPVKPITTGEGGMITTDNVEYAKRMKNFRNHCITTDHRQRHEEGSWFYEQVDIGFNYRLTDIQSALGVAQLKKVPAWTKRRQKIAAKYNAVFSLLDTLEPLSVNDDVSHAYHLYVIKLNLDKLKADRGEIFKALRAENIGVNVHYVPVHLHPYYREYHKTSAGMCPVSESVYERIISLPIFAGMNDQDVQNVIDAVSKVCHAYAQ